ncbi:dienelactone hydrolase family protein [Williamsia sterculiae]|uniref:Dienelactone hydrolase family protein n=1 Tax=Williamsia sterculiae TaxID=1344003 RepID=A0A1N7E0A7_9NOCA|nr:Dienelactone hydrolase family protein [Williamsia sterculiae]
MADDDLADFEKTRFGATGDEFTVYRKGTGPAVIVIAEMPGITPEVAAFGRRVADIGCTAVLPSLFGTDGRDALPSAHGTIAAARTALGTMTSACISKEFTVLATGRSSPVVAWLRALARSEHDRCGGPGVGAIGMCFTGGFALSMAVDDRLLAPVLAQPGLPFAVTPGRARNIDISPADLQTVKQRCAAGLQVKGVRFSGDRMCPRSRFRFLRDQLGDAFLATEVPNSAANKNVPVPPHSPMTLHLVDEPGEPTREALDEVLAFFVDRLQVTPPD